MNSVVTKIITSSNESIRILYQRRNLTHPTDGNRNLLNISICLILLIAMIVALFRVEYASIYPIAHLSYPTGYLTRHMMGIFVILLFLFIDGSPETLGLGVFLGCEAVARSLDYQWISLPHSLAFQHYLFQMGDIFRVFFALQLARIGPKSLWPWIKWGTILSLPYGIAMEQSHLFFDVISPHIRTLRDLVGGLFSAWICCRVAFAIAKDQLPLRVIALCSAAVAFLESPTNILWDVIQNGHVSELTRVSLGFYRTLSYYLFALSAFINISTIEHRVRVLSSAKAEQRLQGMKEEQRVYEAIAKTTQMLAHDVRKPFSLFKAYFDTLSTVDSAEEARKIMRSMLIDVQRSLKNVDQLIADIMDIDRDIKTDLQPISLDAVLAASLEQVFRVSDNAKIRFHYHFKHTGKIIADEHQLQRVIANILENAEQAIKGKKESITFSTENQSMGNINYIRFSIHNTGSIILPENIANIFDAFFTTGQQKGTGLGLAIVKKIITEHGGEVLASSSVDGTAFHILLPATQLHERSSYQRLPIASEHLQLSTFTDKKNPFINPPSLDFTIKDSSIAALQLRVLIIDDEMAYANAVKANIRPLLPNADIHIAKNPEEAMERIGSVQPDLLICDYHFETSDLTGLDIITAYKKSQPNGKVILHTNHFVQTSQLRKARNTIDLVMAKPLSPVDFEKLIKQHQADISAAASNELPTVALIDDEAIFVEAALLELSGYTTHIFDHPEQFDRAIKADPSLLTRINTLIIDHHFGPNQVTGLDYAASIRERFGSRLNIILHTNESENTLESRASENINAIATKGKNNLRNALKKLQSA